MVSLRVFSFRIKHVSLVRSMARFMIIAVQFLCILALLTACTGNSTDTPGPSGTTVSPATNARPESTAASYPQTEIVFEVKTPSRLADGQSLYIEFLDEVTGLALNASRQKMQTQDGQNFNLTLPFVVGSVLKYRYLRDMDQVGIEYTSLNQQVRYRMYFVDGPGKVIDLITAWNSEPVNGMLGRIQGNVADKSNNAPIVNALVTAGGHQTLSASDGSFIIEGLPPGNHNLVVYHPDGSFRPFQQGALVAADSTTPALVLMQANPTVNITFLVSPPEDHLKGVPVRLVGNTYSSGNTFADLRGGLNVLASRAPLLALQTDGRYALTLRLPVGLDLRYKYTLGDGFWNSERAADGGIRTRQLIVPGQDVTIEEKIETWKTPGLEPVSFTVTVPMDTPASSATSIQFNPYGWTEPIPMWPLGNNRWYYILYNPLNLLQNASYRYCRNEQCGFADAADTAGASATGKTFQPSNVPQNIEDTVTSWAWLEPIGDPVIVSAGQITPKPDFLAGVELMPAYHPSWQPYLGNALQSIKDIGSNSVLLSPTWRMTHQSPPVMEPVSGKDPLWSDLTFMAMQAQQKGLTVMIHPVLDYPQDPQAWWQGAARDEGWWQSWFDRYRTFLLYHADMATQTGAKALIIGDETILPALPGGVLADGTPSGVPGSAEDRWKRLIADVRIRYSGQLVWMVPYNGKLPPLPAFISDLDYAYIQITPPVASSDTATQQDIEAYVAAYFDADLVQLRDLMQNSVVVGLKTPSVRGSYDGCIETGNGCLALRSLDKPVAGVPGVEISLREQADVYSAVLSVINQRNWVAGFFSVGYYPPVESRDLTVSVHGKPAGDLLWYWYPRLLGQTPP